ncbi:MAG TPA: hypothetical protein VFA45_24810 [Actinomycetes bacterium]|nr:hypothetical protein [Actinomycetes bacterium]
MAVPVIAALGGMVGLQDAKIGILAASIVASGLGWVVFRAIGRLPRALLVRSAAATAPPLDELTAPVDPERAQDRRGLPADDLPLRSRTERDQSLIVPGGVMTAVPGGSARQGGGGVGEPGQRQQHGPAAAGRDAQCPFCYFPQFAAALLARRRRSAPSAAAGAGLKW